MKLADVKDRHFVNQIIATALLLHLVTVMLAARFELLWLTQLMLVYGLILYFVLGPIFFGCGIAPPDAQPKSNSWTISGRYLPLENRSTDTIHANTSIKPRVCSPA